MGYGSIAFFEISDQLALMFSVISLFSIPLFYLFYQGDYYDEQWWVLMPFYITFLGNIGGTSMFCQSVH